ncbi:hypothetical protein [Desulfurobacterium atlanticum]|uniref:Uncharacterized protein n=1 Tax=Desulfurobacterium atlanticum TaxID=240169 RepID=A0A238ZB84_9BACT|nr:hypothetical protein [Desulfurobacterium atlanticum]SNR80560.1 hypothetical protein SAMN06265340_10787 [Desulfurobacterium atlanticum]
MKKFLIFAITAVAFCFAGFLYFFPADVTVENLVFKMGGKVSSVKGNGFSISLNDVEFKGLKIDSVTVENKILSVVLRFDNDSFSTFSFLDRKLSVNLNRLPFIFDNGQVRGTGDLTCKGVVSVETLKGNLEGQIKVLKGYYNGISIGSISGKFQYKDGKVKASFESSIFKGNLDGEIKKDKAGVVFKGVFRGSVAGSRVVERISFRM